MDNWIEGKAFVPDINDEKLNTMIQKIVPVIRRDDKLYKIEIPDLRKTAYTWSAKTTEEYSNLKDITRIKTHHYCGYYAFFKPSIAEVLAQIPEDIIDNVVAFEIVDEDVKIFNYGNGHLATTILYKQAQE